MTRFKVRSDDESCLGTFERSVNWIVRQKLTPLNGLYYDDPLDGPDGICLILFVRRDTKRPQIEQAESTARSLWDVTRTQVWEIPDENWKNLELKLGRRL